MLTLKIMRRKGSFDRLWNSNERSKGKRKLDRVAYMVKRTKEMQCSIVSFVMIRLD